jgi:hypothetical protein
MVMLLLGIPPPPRDCSVNAGASAEGEQVMVKELPGLYLTEYCQPTEVLVAQSSQSAPLSIGVGPGLISASPSPSFAEDGEGKLPVPKVSWEAEA